MTKEKVIDILKGIKDGTALLIPNIAEDGEKAIDIAIKAVEHPEPHWIPVTERLPEKSGEYLVTVKWVTGESDVDVYEYDARHKTWNDGESAGGERAVAWCNLPEPYKGVTE